MLASSTNHCRLATDRLVTITVLSAHWQRYHLRHETHCCQLRLHSTSWCLINQNINKHNNIAPTVTFKIKESQTNICRFTCLLTCRTRHYKTWQRLPSDMSKSRLCYR